MCGGKILGRWSGTGQNQIWVWKNRVFPVEKYQFLDYALFFEKNSVFPQVNPCLVFMNFNYEKFQSSGKRL